MSQDLQKKVKLFIVDDHDAIVKMLKKHLSKNEVLEIHTFDSGEACVNNMGIDPEIIILDFDLQQSGGRLNGMDVVKAVQALGYFPKIIMLTGQENGKIVLELINHGVRDYIIKDENAFTELNDVILDFLNGKMAKPEEEN